MNEDNLNFNRENHHLFGEKDQLIAHFQEVTSLEDIGQCLEILEAANWNLDEAIQTYLTTNEIIHQDVNLRDQQNEQIKSNANNEDNDIEIIGTSMLNQQHTNTFNIENILRNVDELQEFATSSNNQRKASLQNLQYRNLNEPRRYLEFEVEYKIQKNLFKLPDTETIHTLKQLCENCFNVPLKNQVIRGWPNKDMQIRSDNIQFRDMNLPLKTTLYLLNRSSIPSSLLADKITSSKTIESNEQTASASASAGSTSKTINNDSCTYEVCIKIENDDTIMDFNINLESNKRIVDVKQAVFKRTRIFINDQLVYLQINSNERYFLNELFNDLTYLHELKQFINDSNKDEEFRNRINLCIKSRIKSNNNHIEVIEVSKQSIEQNEVIDVDDASIHDFDANDDDLTALILNQSDTITKKRAPLMPDAYDNDYEAIENFISEFLKRYGPLIPIFFIGPLENAIHDALLCPAKDRKLLGIYLHSDHTIYCNIFCSKSLCDEAIIHFLSANFLIWPWDLTSEKNEKKFYEYCTKNLGSIATQTIRNFKHKLPAFLIVTRIRSGNEILAVIEGDASKDQMINNLMHAYDVFEAQRVKDELDEKQREERERIKREQDAAYQASLDYDKAKRQRQEDELREEQEKRLNAERIEKEKLNEFERKKQLFKSLLPLEPTINDSKLITTIRLKQPNGDLIQRKFLINDSLKAIIFFAGSLGYFIDEYKLLSSWPRRDLTLEDQNNTLEKLKLYPQETIIIEQR